MKLLVVLFSLTCVAFARYRRAINDSNPWFNTDDFRPEFREYRLTECTDEVNQCLKSFHQKAKACVDSSKQNPKIVTCMDREDLKTLHTAFIGASRKWHKSMDMCLAGEECNDCPPLVQNDGVYNDDDDDTQPRDKRSRQQSSSESSEDNEGEQAKKLMKKCWKGVHKEEKKCLQKALNCGKFSSCYGQSTGSAVPTEPRLLQWYTAIKSQRAQTAQLLQQEIDLMSQCLSVPARSARDAYIDDPAGVVVELDEY